MKKKDNNFIKSAQMNVRSYGLYLDMITELAISMFDWRGLPPSVNVRYMELKLLTEGKVAFFKEDDLGDDAFLALPFTSNGLIDLYGIPTARRAYGQNGYCKQLNNDDSVIIWNNYLYKNSINTIELFAQRLANLDRVIDVNTSAQRTPVLLQGSEEQRLTLQNLYQQYDGNMPFVFGDKSLSRDVLKCFKTDAPFIADSIYQLKVQYWNEMLTYLGISNVNVTKKERLVSDEVVRNQGGVLANRYSRLCMRQEACEKINRMFGLNCSVEFRDDLRVDDIMDIEGVDADNE